jgi:hypothetical protein
MGHIAYRAFANEIEGKIVSAPDFGCSRFRASNQIQRADKVRRKR